MQYPVKFDPTVIPQVLNFYDSQDLRFLKTVAVMEVLEGVIFLNKEHSQSFLGRSDVMRDIGRSSRQIGNVVEVVITAGETGLLRLFRVEIVEVNALCPYHMTRRCY